MIAWMLTLMLSFQAADFVAGAVVGRLETVDGVPAVATRVSVFAYPASTGRPGDSQNYFFLGSPVDKTLTDNEGNYRMQELRPGRYFVLGGALPNGTYYPAAIDVKDADVVTVVADTETRADFKLLHKLGGKVSGKINANMRELGPRTATITGPPLEDLLAVPVKFDGSFEFGHLPPGNKYLVSLYPPTSGIASYPVTVGQGDVSGLALTPLPTKRVSGRIVIRNGGIPHGILGFVTPTTFVSGKISNDGTFAVDLHSTQHQIDFSGLPVGYSLASVRVGGQDTTAQGISVTNADVSDVVITLNAPRKLAVVKGKITGLPPAQYGSTAVVMTGPTFNRGQADVQPDGTYQFDAVVPGLYRLVLDGVPNFKPMTVVVEGFDTYQVDVAVNPN